MNGTKVSATDGRGASAFGSARLSQHALHGRVVQSELVCDRANLPFFCMEEAQNLRLRFLLGSWLALMNGAAGRAAIEASDGVSRDCDAARAAPRRVARRYKASSAWGRFSVFHLGPFRRRRAPARPMNSP
jgi:hypothetical protein